MLCGDPETLPELTAEMLMSVAVTRDPEHGAPCSGSLVSGQNLQSFRTSLRSSCSTYSEYHGRLQVHIIKNSLRLNLQRNEDARRREEKGKDKRDRDGDTERGEETCVCQEVWWVRVVVKKSQEFPNTDRGNGDSTRRPRMAPRFCPLVFFENAESEHDFEGAVCHPHSQTLLC